MHLDYKNFKSRHYAHGAPLYFAVIKRSTCWKDHGSFVRSFAKERERDKRKKNEEEKIKPDKTLLAVSFRSTTLLSRLPYASTCASSIKWHLGTSDDNVNCVPVAQETSSPIICLTFVQSLSVVSGQTEFRFPP